MPRMTRLQPGDTRYSLSASLLEAEGPNGWYGEAVKRLAAFEDLQEQMQTLVREIPGRQAELRAQGKEKTVTFRELTAQKMTAQMWLDMARDAGVEE